MTPCSGRRTHRKACSGRLRKRKEAVPTTNDKYEITDIAHGQHAFLFRIRALRDIGAEVKAGDLGGFVESESNLSFEPGDDAWLFDDAIACNNAYVDKGSQLRKNAVACHNAYVSHGTVMTGSTRAEDDAYLRGALLSGRARASGQSMILHSQDTLSSPMLSGQCAVYGKVSGNVRLTGTAIVISGEEICNDTKDTLVITGKNRSVIRGDSRDELKPRQDTKERAENGDKNRKRGFSR